MGLVISVVALVVQAVIILTSLVATAVAIPFITLEAILTLIGTALVAFISLLQNRYFAIALIALALYVFFVGPFAQDNTSDVIEFINFLYECVFRRPYEVFDKFVLLNVRSSWIYATNGLNNAFVYIGYNAKVLWTDLRSILECYYLNGDYSVILEVPYSLWSLFIGPSLFLFETAPLKNKAEIFNDANVPRDWGYHYPLENANDPPFARFEYSPLYSAQGPAIQPSARPFFQYPARGQRIQLLRIAEDAGLFFTRIVSDLRYPSSRFFPNFILRTSSRFSYWREGGDLICRTAEYSTVTSIWPWNPSDGTQPIRTEFTKYLCKSIRIVGNVLRFVALIATDVSTFQRQSAFNATCNPTTSSFLQRIVGVPVVDLFVSPLLPNSSVVLNLNIFKSNYRFCKFAQDALNQTLVPPIPPLFVSTCNGLALGSYVANPVPGQPHCLRWPGLLPPTSSDRIDYVAELTLPLKQFVELLLSPGAANAGLLQPSIDRAFAFLNQVIDFFTSQLIYFFNAIPNALCYFPAIQAQMNRYFNQLFISLLELIYQPDRCADVVGFSNQDENIFYCLIALGSRANQGFFVVLCNLFDGGYSLGIQIQELNCDTTGPQNRKRQTLASQRFTQSDEPASWTTKLRIYSYYYAYHSREMLRVAQECLLHEKSGSLYACNSTCSLAPCLPKGLNCVHEKLSNDNPWSELLRPANVTLGESSYVRSAILTAAMALDVSRGCNDNVIRSMHSSITAVVNLLRDLVIRYLVVTEKFAPTFDVCMKAAHAAVLNSTLTIEEVQRNYLICIGMQPKATGNQTNDVWSSTLREHGIVPNNEREVSRCANILHRMKLVVDDVEPEIAFSPEHITYRSCSYMMAFGARAVAERATNLKVADFLGYTNAPFAILSSTQNIDSRNYAHALSGIAHLPELPTSFVSPAAVQVRPAAYVQSIGEMIVARVDYDSSSYDSSSRNSTFGGGGGTPQTPLAAALYSTHRIGSFGYAYFNYLADVFEHVVKVRSSGEEKDELTAKLYGRIVSVVGASDTLGKQAQQEFGRRVRNMEREAEQAGNVYEKRAVVVPHDVFKVYASTMFWVDRISMFADDELNTPKSSRWNHTRTGGSSAAKVEMFISLGRRVDALHAPLTIGMRTVSDYATTNTFRSWEPLSYEQALAFNNAQEPYSITTLDDVRKALQAYLVATKKAALTDNTAAVLYQQTATALEMSKQLDSLLTMRSYRDALVTKLGSSAYHSISMIMRVFWAIAKQRIQPDALPALQMAHVTIDAMMNGESDDLRMLLEGRRGYIPGAGYVSREAYDEFMQQSHETRQFFMKAYFYALDDNEAHHVYLYSARRNAKARIEKRVQMKNLLAGGSALSRLIASKRAGLRRANFYHRSMLLRKYGYHLDDTDLHRAAGRGWVHYKRFVDALATNNTAAMQAMSQLVVDDASEDFIQILDNLFATLFNNTSGAFTDGVDEFFNQLVDVGENIFVDIVSNSESLWDDFKTSAKCQGPNDYRINGTGVYRIGCIPFIDERLFNWVRVYPAPSSDGTPSVLDALTGPGYIEWPADMLLPGGDCSKPHSALAQCPANFSANLLSNPFDFVFNQVCITNMCSVSGFGSGTSIRPLCPFCDYCPRRWKSTAQFGLTNGYQVLALYDRILRFVFTEMFRHPEGFWFVVVLFLLLEFPAYFPPAPFVPISSTTWSAIVMSFVLIGELFFQKRPERAVYAFIDLVLVRLFAGGAAWFLFATYVVVNFGPFFYGTPVFATFETALDWLTQNVFLGSLLTYYLDALLIVDSLLSGIGINAFTRAGLIAARDNFAATTAITTPPTESEFYYSIFASFRVFTLVVPSLLVILGVGTAIYVAFLLAPSIFALIGYLFQIFQLVYSFLLGRRVTEVETETELQQERIDELERDNDELLNRLHAQ